MNWLRVFLAMTLLVIGVEALIPLLSAKNAFLLPLIRQNCGAVPLFLKDVFSVSSPPNPKYWEGFITCGGSTIGFLLLPGTLTLFAWVYKLAKPSSKEYQ